mmetsp:Transcript_24750/g.60929  ORF Transcript_24750/g.60929 Transcript_24750/m.60929 type:complete len:334 (-) Transcript_24750:1903-2904(-)
MRFFTSPVPWCDSSNISRCHSMARTISVSSGLAVPCVAGMSTTSKEASSVTLRSKEGLSALPCTRFSFAAVLSNTALGFLVISGAKGVHSAETLRTTFSTRRRAPSTCFSRSSRSHCPKRVAGAMIKVAPERTTPTPTEAAAGRAASSAKVTRVGRPGGGGFFVMRAIISTVLPNPAARVQSPHSPVTPVTMLQQQQQLNWYGEWVKHRVKHRVKCRVKHRFKHRVKNRVKHRSHGSHGSHAWVTWVKWEKNLGHMGHMGQTHGSNAEHNALKPARPMASSRKPPRTSAGGRTAATAAKRVASGRSKIISPVMGANSADRGCDSSSPGESSIQ